MDAKKHPFLAVLVGHHLGSWAPNPKTSELVDPFTQWLGNIFQCIWCCFGLVFFLEFQIPNPRLWTDRHFDMIQESESWQKVQFFTLQSKPRIHADVGSFESSQSSHSPVVSWALGCWQKTAGSKIQFAKRVRDDRVERKPEKCEP